MYAKHLSAKLRRIPPHGDGKPWDHGRCHDTELKMFQKSNDSRIGSGTNEGEGLQGERLQEEKPSQDWELERRRGARCACLFDEGTTKIPKMQRYRHSMNYHMPKAKDTRRSSLHSCLHSATAVQVPRRDRCSRRSFWNKLRPVHQKIKEIPRALSKKAPVCQLEGSGNGNVAQLTNAGQLPLP